jgi:peptidoglycan/LPS O-acetylase OafA/YrhL
MLVVARMFPNLQRITSSGNFIPEIDGLRFIAITSVVLFHIQYYACTVSGKSPHGFFSALIEHGFRGVPLFFTISGLILGLPFITAKLKSGPDIKIGKYFLRSLTRLEPPYLLNLATCAVLLAIFNPNQAIAAPLAASAVYLHNIMFGHSSAINGVAWSLEIEAQFYCVVPFLVQIFNIKSTKVRRSLLGLLVMLFSVLQLVKPSSARWDLSLAAYLQFFLAGLLLADFYALGSFDRRSKGFLWDSAAAILLLFIFYPPEGPMFGIAFPIAILLFYFCVLKSILFRSVMRMRFVTTCGGMCYSIYLFHYQVISLIGRFTAHLAVQKDVTEYLLIQAVMMVPGILLFCSVFFLLVERPCMRKDWPRRLAGVLRIQRTSPSS